MNVRMLGTGAAEGIPGFYCRCRVCTEAQRRGGRDLRTRSSVLFDDALRFDYGPDTYAQKVRHGLDLTRLTALVFTHGHEDHFTPAELIFRAENFIQVGAPRPLTIYGNERVVSLVEALRKRCDAPDDEFDAKLRIAIEKIEFFKPFTTGSFTIHPVRASHDPSQSSCNHVVLEDGRAVLVGFDTGWYDDETWDYLSQFRFDCVLMDCTTGMHAEGRYHLGLPDNVRVREEMAKRGMIGDGMRYVLTHISHGGGWLHDELEEHAVREGMIAAYDGMVIELPPSPASPHR